MLRRMFCLLLCAVMTICLFSGCNASDGAAQLTAAVLYDGKAETAGWQDVYSHLDQSLTLNFTVRAVDVLGVYSLKDVDVVFADESIISSSAAEKTRRRLETFVNDGGYLFLTNGFHSFFDTAFLGAEKFVKIEQCPAGLQAADAGEVWQEIQGIITDYASVYGDFADYERLSSYDYGWGMLPSTAQSLVTCGGITLYAANRVGAGTVLFTNPMLPNAYVIDGLSMLASGEGQQYFSDTSSAAARLLENAFISLASKERFGWSVSRTFGTFGGSGMSWQAHYEEERGIENNAAVLFSQLLMENGQVPSFTLIRSSYTWFHRAESVTYLLNRSDSGLSFQMDLEESAYSSGTHVLVGGSWLSINSTDYVLSYFEEDPDLDLRAYPCVGDFNADGFTDLICGSCDGYFYYYIGTGFENGRLSVTGPYIIGDVYGSPIHVSDYSAPVLYDLDGDGVSDIITGSDDGCVYLCRGTGNVTFSEPELLIDTGAVRQTMPEAADLDGDGTVDIIVGTNDGKLLAYYGVAFKEAEDLSACCVQLGSWLAPRVYDYGEDGRPDIVVGTADGYVAVLANSGSGWELDGYLQLDEMNFRGNYNAKFGSNCVPCFYDLDSDGNDDIICGSMEYGLAYSIDSEYYPWQQQLREQVEYLQEMDFYIGLHFYTNSYASAEREEWELHRHLQALDYYGIDSHAIGANQHTWYTSTRDLTQTFRTLWNGGILWNDGYSVPSGVSNAPEANAENVLCAPYYLELDGEKTLLMQNVSTITYVDEEWSDLMGKYDLPVMIFFHCESIYRSDAAAKLKVEQTEAFREKFSYSFMSEDQLMKAIAASFNTEVDVADENGVITVSADTVSTKGHMYDKDYQASVGAKISFAPGTDMTSVSVDADVYRVDGYDVYVSLNRDARIVTGAAAAEEPHITRVNVAARIERTEKGACVTFLDGGMMQVEVSGTATTADEGWLITETEGGCTVFTRYGDAAQLNIEF